MSNIRAVEDYTNAHHAAQRVDELRRLGFWAWLHRGDSRKIQVLIEPGQHPNLGKLPERRHRE